MLCVIQIVGFLSQLFFKNKLMKQPHFLPADTNSQKRSKWIEFFWLGMVKNECDQSDQSQDSKIVSQNEQTE